MLSGIRLLSQVNGVVLVYQEPAEAANPRQRWRLYQFKGGKPFQARMRGHFLVQFDPLIRRRKTSHLPAADQGRRLCYATSSFDAAQYTRQFELLGLKESKGKQPQLPASFEADIGPLQDPLPIHRQSVYLFGRERRVADIPTDHPSCSKQHSVLQFRRVRSHRPDEHFAVSSCRFLVSLAMLLLPDSQSNCMSPRVCCAAPHMTPTSVNGPS
jgi:hypothetical protein